MSFRGFARWHEKIFKGGFLLLRERVRQQAYGLFDDKGVQGERELLAVAIHFQAYDASLAPLDSLGGFWFHPRLSQARLREFMASILAEIGAAEKPGLLTPFNAHMTLGLAHPESGVSEEKITYLCSGRSRQLDWALNKSELFVPSRKLHALLTPITPVLKEKVQQGVMAAEARGFQSRAISFLHFKRDIEIYNRLVNQAMRNHPHFYPLSFAEEWDVMKAGPLFLRASWFRFLMHKGKEIGFCFAVPDYNPYLSSDLPDAVNLMRLQERRWRREHRARLIYSGLLPEYQGQGLFKAVRHRVVLEMIKDGVTEFESSYVDEENQASLRNVESTGGYLSHRFLLYSPRPSLGCET